MGATRYLFRKSCLRIESGNRKALLDSHYWVVGRARAGATSLPIHGRDYARDGRGDQERPALPEDPRARAGLVRTRRFQTKESTRIAAGACAAVALKQRYLTVRRPIDVSTSRLFLRDPVGDGYREATLRNLRELPSGCAATGARPGLCLRVRYASGCGARPAHDSLGATDSKGTDKGRDDDDRGVSHGVSFNRIDGKRWRWREGPRAHE